MAEESPRYLIHYPTYIEGVGILAREGPEEYDLGTLEPRNSWEPCNDAAREAFARRDARKLAESLAAVDALQSEIAVLKADGADEADLAGLREELAKLRTAHSKLPAALKRVPKFGAKETHTLHEAPAFAAPPPTPPLDLAILAAKANGDSEEDIATLRHERLITAARAGGASEADIAQLHEALKAGHAGKAAEALKKGQASGAKAREAEEKRKAALRKTEAEQKAKAEREGAEKEAEEKRKAEGEKSERPSDN